MSKYAKIDMPNFTKMTKELGFDRKGKVQIEATRLSKEYMKSYVPLLDGNLRKEAKENYDEVIYGPLGSKSEPYAQRVYNLPQEGTNWTTPGTGSFWNETMMADKGEQLHNDIQKFADTQK